MFLFKGAANWKMLIKLAEKGGDIWNLMTGGPWKMTSLLESKDITSNAKLTADVRRRGYEILLFEKPKENEDDPHIVIERWADTVVEQQVGKAPPFHPGLASLWNKDNHAVKDIR